MRRRRIGLASCGRLVAACALVIAGAVIAQAQAYGDWYMSHAEYDDQRAYNGQPQFVTPRLMVWLGNGYYPMDARITYTLPDGSKISQRQLKSPTTGEVGVDANVGPSAVGTYPYTLSPIPEVMSPWKITLPAVLDTGTLEILAATDPRYAINPFHVTQRTAPSDPAVRWAGYKSRVGTYLPTDQYHWWRFDVTNRAEVQDAFWNVTSAADTRALCWTGAFPDTPGDVTQAWRDAFMRCLNLQRYYYMRDAATYIQEDDDPYNRVGCQAAALIEAQRTFTHLLSDADMPAGFQYSDQAKFFARYSSIGTVRYPSDISSFIDDDGNASPGHRFAALNPGVDIFAFGRVGIIRYDGQRPSPTLVYYSDDTTTTYRSGPNFSAPLPSTCPPPPQFDPFDYVKTWPYRGYVTMDDNYGGPLPFSIEMPAAGLILDPSGATVTVTCNGVPVNVTITGASFQTSWREHFEFDVAQPFFNTEDMAKAGHVPYQDTTVTVTITGLRFSTTRAYTPTGKASDVAPYIAASNPKAFQPHTISWTFKVFDPVHVQSVALPTPKTEITNLSTRASIGSGDNVMIAGFVVTGNEPLRVAIRAQGPSLAQYGIQKPAINPRVEVYQLGVTNTALGENDDWKIGPNWRLVQSYGLNPSDDRDSVAVATLMPGSYSAIVSDPTNPNVGVGIVEVFALDAQSQSRLVNVSTRAYIGTGENVLIGGFILQQRTTVLVRTQGPSLTRYGLSGVVAGTKLTLYRQSDHAILATNNGWNTVGSAGNGRLLTDLAGYAPVDANEAAQLITLEPGGYSALVESADGKPGVGIVEVFNVN